MYRDELVGQKFKYDPNRAYFSEAIVLKETEFVDVAPKKGQRIIYYGMLSKNMLTKKYTNPLQPIDDPHHQSCLQPALRWKKYSTRVAISFPIQTIKPKVQLLHVAAPGHIPREVEVERRLRQYSHKFIGDMLLEAGVTTYQLVPYNVARRFLLPADRRNCYSAAFSRLPLEWFDDFDYDCMLPNDWLDLGILLNERHPIPAEAFLPSDKLKEFMEDPYMKIDVEQYRQTIFKWGKVSVSEYNPVSRRWLVTDLETAQTYRIPRIFLMFIAEDPANFVARIKQALKNRRNADCHLKLSLIMDSMMLTGVPIPRENILNKIGLLALPPGKARKESIVKMLSDLMGEVKLHYQRFLAAIELYDSLKRERSTYAFLELPDPRKPRAMVKFADPTVKFDSFDFAYNWLRLNTLYCLPEVIHTMDNVVIECARVSNMLFFTTAISKTASLHDFQTTQENTAASTVAYIKGLWVDNMAAMMCMCLRSVGKGWFDISMSDWTIFMYSKVFRLLQLIQFRMQNALRNLVEGSIRMWRNLLCRPCECLMHVEDDYKWNSQDLITSPFLPGVHHVFYMVLNIDEKGPFYSTDPDHYEPALLKIFDVPMHESHFVHLVDPLVMQNLVYPDLYLSSVGSMEEVIASTRDLMIECYHKAIIPLRAYCREYDIQCEFFFLDKLAYLREFKAANKSSQEHQDEISMHLRMKANLEATLPPSIQIGPFLVNVNPLKVHLVAKRQDFATRVIDLLLEKLRTETQDIVDEYAHIVKRLSERPLSIEQIFENRDWMETLPEIIANFEGQMRLKLFEYDILDHFWIPLPNEDFNIKWSALAGPMRCERQISTTYEMYDEEVERFQKQQTSDLVAYDEKVEGLNMTVSQFSSQYDIGKTTENSIEIKKLWKQINETMEFGNTLNKRQVLFENPKIDLRPIMELRSSFDPYKTLWVTGADFLKWEEAWIGNPLSNVDPVSIQASTDEYLASIKQSIQTFAELPKVQEVALYFEQRIQQFQPMLDVMVWIKNPCWIVFHWQELCRQTGLEIKFSNSMNLHFLIDKGIMKFYDEVGAMSALATENHDLLIAQAEEEERLVREAEEALIAKKNNRRGRKIPY